MISLLAIWWLTENDANDILKLYAAWEDDNLIGVLDIWQYYILILRTCNSKSRKYSRGPI